MDYRRLIPSIIVAAIIGCALAFWSCSTTEADKAFTGPGQAPVAKGIGDVEAGVEFSIKDAIYQINRSRLGDVVVALLGTKATIKCEVGPAYCKNCDELVDPSEYPELPALPDNPKVADIYELKIGPNGIFSVSAKLDDATSIAVESKNYGKWYIPASECPVTRVSISAGDVVSESLVLYEGVGIGSNWDEVREALGQPNREENENEISKGTDVILWEYDKNVSFDFAADTAECFSIGLGKAANANMRSSGSVLDF